MVGFSVHMRFMESKVFRDIRSLPIQQSITDIPCVSGESEKFIPDIVISGGQTGADIGALRAAKALGIATGGYAPLGWRTETGERPSLGIDYGLVESDSADY